MRLTSFTDYSLRTLMYLALEPGYRATIGEVAAVFGVSEHHLTKVVHFLGTRGWLLNVRGKGGGLELAMPPECICVGDVVRECEGPVVAAECFEEGGGCCSIAGLCHLRGILADAAAALYDVLYRYTVADLVHNRKELAVVLFGKRLPRAGPPAAAAGR